MNRQKVKIQVLKHNAFRSTCMLINEATNIECVICESWIDNTKASLRSYENLLNHRIMAITLSVQKFYSHSPNFLDEMKNGLKWKCNILSILNFIHDDFVCTTFNLLKKTFSNYFTFALKNFSMAPKNCLSVFQVSFSSQIAFCMHFSAWFFLNAKNAWHNSNFKNGIQQYKI